ncbi:MAG: sialidase family protein [Verrucomicrobiota bacterium]
MTALLVAVLPPVDAAAASQAEIVEVKKIWDAGSHNAFTDLIWWQDQWWCTFREADGHVGGDGAIRILASRDGVTWKSEAALTEKGVDLRDPKFSVTPKGQLMLNCGGSIYEGKTLKGRRSRVMFSADGRSWSAPQKILKEGEWCWRVTWHEGTAYSAVYRSVGSSQTPGPEWGLVLYRSKDGVTWDLMKEMEVKRRPNETTLRFEPNGEMIALVRREAEDTMGYIGRAKAPYTEWTWQTSNHRFGGQNFIKAPDGRWIVGTRDYSNAKKGTFVGAKTILAELESSGGLRVLATFPSGGDTSYPGMVWRDGQLAFAYYSSHEGKSAIYFARVKL